MKGDAEIEYEEKILLQEALECDNLSVDVLDIVETMKKKKVQDIHPYTITAPANEKGRWQTFIKDDEKGRRKVSATTEMGLYKKLYEHYFHQAETTMESLYPAWINKRYEEGANIRTVRRNENHWDKYYQGHSVTKKGLHRITVDDIEAFFHEAIRKHGMTTKELANMKFIFVDMMKLAKRKKLISCNPFLEVEIKTTACKPPKKKKDTSRVYLPEEKEKVFVALNEELRHRPHVTDMYAVFLLFKLGLRIGELVALQWEDIDFQNREIHVHRMESKVQKGEIVCVGTVEYTKKKSPHGDRFLPLGEYEIEIFHKVRQVNEMYGYFDKDFVFCDEKGRTNIRSIDNLIRKVCNMAGVEEKSSHDIRRTVASELFSKGISMEIIRGYLGHADLKTTSDYILDCNGKEQRNNKLLTALEDMNGLKRTQVS